MKIVKPNPLWIGATVLSVSVAVAFKFALAAAVTGSFNPDNAPVGYIAQDELTSFNLRSGTETLFRPTYEKDYWSGGLFANLITDQGDFSGSHLWDAGDQLDSRDLALNPRIIVTVKDDTAKTKIPFQWSSLSSTQQGYLGNSTNGPKVLNFLRGDRSNEAAATPPGTFRDRGNPLGDIIHSRPYYLADDRLGNGSAKTASAPLPTIFVGANDGMLHAFDATTGDERWAYVPSMLINKMSKLTEITYPSNHRYYVDGSVNIGFISSGTKRIVVGALGAGGKGLFALDITGDDGLAPADEDTAASHIMWEISNASTNFANLGYTYSNPVLAKVGSGTGTDAVIVGNGYGAADGKVHLYTIKATDGTLLADLSPTSDSCSNNGLSSPTAVDTNGDGVVDVVYAGDLFGRLWKFTLGTTNTAEIIFFTGSSASDCSGGRAITSTPGVALHPNGGYMINFATGSMLFSSDYDDASTVYAAYGYWDRPSAYSANAAILTQTLTQRCYSFDGSGNCTKPVRTVTSNSPTWTAGAANHKAWKVNLTGTGIAGGERVVGDTPFIENGRFYFNAYNPTVSTTLITGADPIRGTNWLMELDYLTGGSKNSPFLDMNGDVNLTDADRITWKTGQPATSPATADGSLVTSTDGIPVGKFVSIGIMSQPLLVQLVSLNDTIFNQNPDIKTPATIQDRGVSGGHFDIENYYGGTWQSCTGSNCSYRVHVHEYDDIYDVTGVNFLDTSTQVHDLSRAITSTSTKFKVLVQNQYMNPATQIHIGDKTYNYTSSTGYKWIKDFQTDPTLNATTLANAQKILDSASTYSLNKTSADYIGSFAVNMPVYAFEQRDWWGGTNGLPADIRVGLHPTYPNCVWSSKGNWDGNLYQPVIPPSTVTATGNGTYPSKTASNNLSTKGIRHNGALTFQVIKFDTPSSALEMNLEGRPEYGWRLKTSQFSSYVLAEYTIFWHYNKGIDEQCFGDPRWTKLAIKDTRKCGSADNKLTTICATNQSAASGTDPQLGSLGAGTGGTIVSSVVTDIANGTKTVITYSDGYVLTITRVTNSNGTKTITTKDNTGTVDKTEVVVNADAQSKSGGDERGLQASTGRISWRELVQP